MSVEEKRIGGKGPDGGWGGDGNGATTSTVTPRFARGRVYLSKIVTQRSQKKSNTVEFFGFDNKFHSVALLLTPLRDNL